MSYTDLHHETPEYMILPKLKFKLTLQEYQNDEDLKNEFLEIITRKNMSKYYDDVCKEFEWEIDEGLLSTMLNANTIAWDNIESTIDTNIDDSSKVRYKEKLEFYCEIGDFDRAKDIATSIFEDVTNSSTTRVEAAFNIYRIAYIKSNSRLMGKMISEITNLMDGVCASGSDWCCRNKLKVYEAIYCLATRNFTNAASLLLDCIPTFESYELLNFKEIVEYTVLAGMISFSRSELDRYFNNNGLLQQALLMESPRYKDYFYSLYDCHYFKFFQCLAWIESEMKANPLLHSHYRYYVREMRLKAYSQLLQAYRTLSLSRMSMEFGVTEEYIEQELVRFIVSGKLHCKIDKVAGTVVTVSAAGCNRGRAPDASCGRESMYQNTIKRGDSLLNRVKKLGQITDF